MSSFSSNIFPLSLYFAGGKAFLRLQLLLVVSFQSSEHNPISRCQSRTD